MTQNDKLKTLKLLAKRYARATGQPQHVALDLVAARLDFPHWNALTGSAKGEWAPSEAQVTTIKAFVERITSYEGSTFDHIFGGPDAVTRGEVRGHPYALKTILGDVHMEGDGWRIVLPENPSTAPRVEIDIKHAQNCPMNDRMLREEAIGIAKELMQSVKARRFADWPRRATKPDAEGKVRHPFLEMEESNLWYCLHCDAEITGCQRRSKNRPRGGAKAGHFLARLSPPGGRSPSGGLKRASRFFTGSGRRFGPGFARACSSRHSSRGC